MAAKKKPEGRPAPSPAKLPSIPPVVEEALREGSYLVEKFVELFPVLVEASGGTKQLREAVRGLAVRGRLNTQLRDDGSAEEQIAPYLTSSGASSGRRASNMESTGATPVAEVVLPETWVWAPFHCVAEIASNLVKPADFQSYPHVAPDNIEKGTGRLLPWRTVADDGVVSSNHRFFAGQVLYSKIRPNLNKVTVVDFEGLCSADMYPLTPRFDARYLNLFMLSDLFLAQVVHADNRVAMPKVNQEQLGRTMVALPPLAEQKRIVARVDQLMGLIDELEKKQTRKHELGGRFAKASLEALTTAEGPEEFNTAWKRVLENWETVLDRPEKVGEIRQWCLDAAFQGRLTGTKARRWAPGSVDERAAEALSTARGRDATNSVLPGRVALAVGPAPMSVPTDWQWIPLMALARLESGHTPSRSHPEYWDGTVPWIGIRDARDHHAKKIQTTAQHVSPLGLANSAARLLPRDTVCLSRTASIGYVTVMGTEMATSQDFVNWVCSKALLSDYLMWLLVCERPSLLRFSEGAVHRTIYYPEVKAFHVAVPPLAEQKRIVAKVDQLMALCDQLEAALLRSEDRGAKLVGAVVQEMVA